MKEVKMRLNAPKKNVWWIATIAVILGVIGHIINQPTVFTISFWLVLIGFILLWLGTFVKGF
jgi:hypothetical protein